MNFSFLRFFKRNKAAEAEVAIAPPPLPPLEKPASERFGKTVMPNVSRVVGVESLSSVPVLESAIVEAAVSAAIPLASAANPSILPGSPPPATGATAARKISLGENGSLTVTPKAGSHEAAPVAARAIALHLADLVPHLPAGLLQATPIDPEQRVLFKASELERGMASGRPTVLLRSIFQQAPDYFLSDVGATDAREVVLPFNKVLEQFVAFQVRPDQLSDESVPQLETPFLKMTIEDSERLGTPPTPIPAPAPPVSATVESEPPGCTAPVAPDESDATPAPIEEAAAASPALRPLRLSLPNEPQTSAAESPASAPVRLEPLPARPPLAPKKIMPNGMGVPATERVPASSGPPVPTPLPSPLAPPKAKRIPFKVTPPSNDLRETAVRSATPAPKVAAVAFADSGPRVRLPLRNVLRGISPFQLSGSIDDVPEAATIEIPFSIIEPQLSLGRVAVSPAQFQAALPEEYRSLLKVEEADLPIALPLQEVLQNLPDESLHLRDDQEEAEIGEAFETPFSTKAAEDAARMKISTGPIAKSGVAAAVSAAPTSAPGEPALESSAPAGLETELSSSGRHARPYTARTALQVAFDTDETLDAKSVVAHASRLPGVSACAIVFSDGLSLAGNIPAEYEAEALCALAPSIVKRIDDQMIGASLGPLNGITLYCAKRPVSFFAHGNICLAALHAAGEIAAEVRARLSCAARELARMYAQPA